MQIVEVELEKELQNIRKRNVELDETLYHKTKEFDIQSRKLNITEKVNRERVMDKGTDKTSEGNEGTDGKE